jgi:integrase
MDNTQKCILCGSTLSPSLVKWKRKKCCECARQICLNNILIPETLSSIFSKKWTANLLVKYYWYLKNSRIRYSSILDNIRRVKMILLIAEKELIGPHEISMEWLGEIYKDKTINIKKARISFLCFLEEQGILKMPDENDLMHASIIRQIERCPKEFKRLMEIYFNTRLELRKRQISNNEANPLALRTIISDITVFTQFTRWITQTHKEVYSWDLIQEEHINEFLLTLTPNNREVVRKDMYALFKLAKRKKLITYIPMIDYPGRELPSTIKTLNIIEQKHVARTIMRSIHTNPLGCILSCLCFFHGLSSRQIRSIKLSDIDLSGKKITFKDRPPAYLSTEELIALGNYVKSRSNMKNNKKREYLFISNHSAGIYENKSLNNGSILRKVKELTGYTTTQLRITCYHSFSARFGPLMLIDAFGLSRTQASRYGRFEEYLLEEEIKDQRT